MNKGLVVLTGIAVLGTVALVVKARAQATEQGLHVKWGDLPEKIGAADTKRFSIIATNNTDEQISAGVVRWTVDPAGDEGFHHDPIPFTVQPHSQHEVTWDMGWTPGDEGCAGTWVAFAEVDGAVLSYKFTMVV